VTVDLALLEKPKPTILGTIDDYARASLTRAQLMPSPEPATRERNHANGRLTHRRPIDPARRLRSMKRVVDCPAGGPVMRNLIKIRLVRTCCFRAAWALGLLWAATETCTAQPPSANGWAGRTVVPKARKLPLKDPKNGTEHSGPAAIYHVTKTNGNSLLLATTGVAGWAQVDQVVPVEQAASYFTTRIQANPRESFNYTMRALVSLHQNTDVERSLADLNEAIRLAPRDVDTRLTRAEVWRVKGDAAKAIDEYSEVIRNDPQVLPAYFGRAAIEGEIGELDKAIADLGSAIRVEPRVPDKYIVRAAAWNHQGSIDKAIADLGTAITLDPRNPATYHDRGLLWSRKKDFDKAIDDYSLAIRLEPGTATGYCSRGFAYKAQKQYDSAIADYSQAVSLDPRDADAFCGRGWCWLEKKEYAKSLSDFGQALRIDPRDACALDGRAWIGATCPNPTYRDGKKTVETAIEACELTRWKEAYCLETLAAGYAETGDFASAVKWQTKAIELEEDPKEKEEYRARLKLFQEKRPYHETKP
jgi:tetratricopeptide (TPR) repeat protein